VLAIALAACAPLAACSGEIAGADDDVTDDAASFDGPAPGADAAGPGADGASPGSDANPAPDANTSSCDGNCYFVRAGAGGANDGSDWANAFDDLPSTLERNHVYWIAAGSYAGRTFDTPAQGSALIEIYRATAASHGTEIGWQPSYANGVALFGALAFTSPSFVFDGGSARAIEVRGAYEGTALSISGDSVTVRNVDVNGDFGVDGNGYHTAGSCTGVSISAANVLVEGCEIHDAADDGVSISGASYLSFVGNTVHRLHGCGTDGGCGPCYNGHSDGIETYNVTHSEFAGNFIYDVDRTSAFFFGGWADELGGGPSDYCEDISLVNNILYSPDTGFVAYIQDVAGIRLYHNVFWGIHQGAYGGLSIGEHVTDLDMYNNIILSINYAHMGASYDAAEHRGDYNLFGISLGQYTDGPNDIVAPDPGFSGIPDMDGSEVVDPSPVDFTPATGSPCIDSGYGGDASIVLPAVDFFGSARDGTPDIGAIEAS